MNKLSKDVFAIMGMCERDQKPFGITDDPRQGAYAFCWAFKISDSQAKRTACSSENLLFYQGALKIMFTFGEERY